MKPSSTQATLAIVTTAMFLASPVTRGVFTAEPLAVVAFGAETTVTPVTPDSPGFAFKAVENAGLATYVVNVVAPAVAFAAEYTLTSNFTVTPDLRENDMIVTSALVHAAVPDVPQMLPVLAATTSLNEVCAAVVN